MLKDSDNLIAEAIFKKIAQSKSHTSGSWENGQKIILDYIQTINPTIEEEQIFDGSGLSRYNKISAKQLNDITTYALKHKLFSQDVIKSLPISGKDGTLEKFKSKDKDIKITAKTGSMSGVMTLSGIIETNKYQNPISFTIMANGPSLERKQWLDYFDDIIIKTINDIRY